MPRSNRSRRRNATTREREDSAENLDSLERLRTGWRRTETRRGAEWNVQPVSAAHALKIYVCPGCDRSIDVGVPHLVAWRADGVLGDQADVGARRHWHNHCWRLG